LHMPTGCSQFKAQVLELTSMLSPTGSHRSTKFLDLRRAPRAYRRQQEPIVHPYRPDRGLHPLGLGTCTTSLLCT
jgi:hypothetical protein